MLRAGFGWAAAWMLPAAANDNNSVAQVRSRATGAFGLLGTLVLFITYPIFNSAQVPYWVQTVANTYDYTELSATPVYNIEAPWLSVGVDGLSQYILQNYPWTRNDPTQWLAQATLALQTYVTVVNGIQTRVFINTLAGMCASVIATFMATRWVGSKISLHHVQTASLVGGASTAAFSAYTGNPWASILAASIAAVLCVYYMQWRGDKDAANGVFAAHAIPGAIGIIGAAIAAGSISVSWAPMDALNQAALLGLNRTILQQGGYICAYGLISFALGAGSGVVSGFFARMNCFGPKGEAERDANDFHEWTLTSDEEQAEFALAAASHVPAKAPEAAPAPAAASEPQAA
jgi:hypothetical protein